MCSVMAQYEVYIDHPTPGDAMKKVGMVGIGLMGHGIASNIVRKGHELAANPRAGLLFHWKALRRQVRIEGPVQEVSAADADQSNLRRCDIRVPPGFASSPPCYVPPFAAPCNKRSKAGTLCRVRSAGWGGQRSYCEVIAPE